jgi:hypothetical protein
MSTKIKFRIGYTAQNGEKRMIYEPDDLHRIALDGSILENYGNQQKPVWEEPFDVAEPPILMRYTGCKDKNDKEIWEGDIVRYRWPNDYVSKGVVAYIAGMFVLDFPDQTDSGPIGFLQTADLEVIGNTFENPELL